MFPSLVCSEEELRELDAEDGAEGQRAYYPTADVKGTACAYAPGRRKIKVPVLAGRNDPDRASFRLRSGGMTDSKGVDSIGRGRGSDGKRGGAGLRRERAAPLHGSRRVGCEN